MPTSEQIESLILSHFDVNPERFNTLALQIAAYEARHGHQGFANSILKIIEKNRTQKHLRQEISPSLQDTVLKIDSEYQISNFISSPETTNRLKRIIEEYRNRDKLSRYNLKNRRKILLCGPAGTGKTLTASVLACELDMPLYLVQLDKIVTKYMGETSAKLRQVFEMIETTPGVYLFDEFDAIGTQRTKDNDVGEIRRVLNSFLKFIENDLSKSIIVCATNNLSLLDNALFRRFDDVIIFKLPTIKEKILLLKHYLCGYEGGLNIESIATKIGKLSHSEIAQIATNAIKDSILSGRKKISSSQIAKAIKEKKSVYKIQL